MRILLVVPRCANPKQTYREYPLGLGLIATALRQAGHEAAVFDQNVEGPDDELLWARVRDFAPRVVGFSVITPGYPAARQQIRRLKQEHPELCVVAGGIHASLFPEDLVADGADAVILGEGEGPMVQLAERIERGLPVPGLDGPLIRSPHRPGSAQDRDLSIIDRSVYNLSRYTHHSMLASLGCPHRCAFCCNYAGTVLRQGVTVRRTEAIIEELRYLVESFAARQVFFVDDVFLLARENVLRFCRRLAAQQLPVEWVAQMRADLIDPEVADALAVAGCRRVYLGVEAGSEAILQRAGKFIDRRTTLRAVQAAQAAGIRVKTGWILGLPGTLDEQYESVRFMCDLRPHEISIHQLIPFPGTDYYARPQKHGLRIRDPKDFASFCFGGLGENVSFDYLSRGQFIVLLEHMRAVLESQGYVSSDRATPQDEYVYTTPLSARSLSVFRAAS